MEQTIKEMISETRLMFILATIGIVVLFIIILRSERVRTILERTFKAPSSSETIETHPDEIIVKDAEQRTISKRARRKK
jgi:hypothetical protein